MPSADIVDRRPQTASRVVRGRACTYIVRGG